jgi:hypothetical protein
MGIGLSIVFTGLCAVVTDGPQGSGQVLLVDARGVGEVRGMRLPEHAPTLAVELASLVNADSSEPSRVVTAWPGAASLKSGNGASEAMVGQLGLWDLAGSELRILVQGGSRSGLRAFEAAPGTSTWPSPPLEPHEPAGWRDIRFVADMRPLADGGQIDPALVAANINGGLPGAIASRILLDTGLLEAGIPSEPAYRDDVFAFADASGQPRLRQALTDSVRWALDTVATSVVIEIRQAAGGPAKRLVLKPSASRHEFFVSNLPVENASHEAGHAMSIDEMTALHFGAYYKLLRHQPADQPLPRLWVSPADRGLGLGGPVMCPPARFTRN